MSKYMESLIKLFAMVLLLNSVCCVDCWDWSTTQKVSEDNNSGYNIVTMNINANSYCTYSNTYKTKMDIPSGVTVNYYNYKRSFIGQPCALDSGLNSLGSGQVLTTQIFGDPCAFFVVVGNLGSTSQ